MTPTEKRAMEVLSEGLYDWVPIDWAIALANETSDGTDLSMQSIFHELVDYLISQDLMLPGELGESGFEAWKGEPAELVGRVVADCIRFNWLPQGASCWLANTTKGDELAASTRRDTSV